MAPRGFMHFKRKRRGLWLLVFAFIANGLIANSVFRSQFCWRDLSLSEGRVLESEINPELLEKRKAILLNNYSLHDPTVEMSLHVNRPWLYNDKTKSETEDAIMPPAQVLLTNYGWNHPNTSQGLREPRGMYPLELLQGVIDHEWFHPTAWEHPETWDRALRYYVFLDIDTCLEYNYPIYGAGFIKNADVYMGRRAPTLPSIPCYNLTDCQPIKQALASPLFAQGYDAVLVVPECYGWGIDPLYRKEIVNDTRLSLVSITSTPDQLQMQVDQGLVPPTAKTQNLTLAERQAIQQCDDSRRDILLSFVGNYRRMPLRKALVELNNGKDVFVVDRNELASHFIDYDDTLTRARYVAAPRGEGLYSYRFTEILSAGAIPVVLADDWVLPFRPELVDWAKCAVIVKEKDVSSVMEILKGFTAQEECSRRKQCFDIYERYMKTGTHIIAGIIEGLERRHVVT